MEITDYIKLARPEFRTICIQYLGEYKRSCPSHPGHQKQRNGLGLHTVQVIEKALHLNQEFNRQDIIEICLAHDLKHWTELPLKEGQVIAIEATKGLPWKIWRRTEHCRLVALILISDMWSAYVNINNLKGE